MGTLDEKCVVLYQHLTYGIRVAIKWIEKIKVKKKCRYATLIHDLDYLRNGMGEAESGIKRRSQIGDSSLLRQFNVFICHNEHMEQYLVQQGFDKEKLINMELFDYLSDCD